MVNPVPTEPDSKICACDTDVRHAVKHGSGVSSYCIKQISLGHKCDQGSSHNIVCIDDNTECKGQMNHLFQLTDRCVCSTGWEGTRLSAIADPNAVYKCGRRIHGDDCTECDKNEGTCFEYYEEGDRKVNCHCPGSTSGTHCETVHASVKCVGETMYVCYNAHPGYDLSDGAWFEVEGRGMDEAKCRGQVVGASDDICQPGEAKVAISFSEAGRDVCGTTMSLYDDYWTRFSNDMAAHKSTDSHMTGDVVVFTTYCMVQHHAAGSMGAKMQPGIAAQGEIGQSTFAALSLVLEDIHGDHIGNDQPIERADKIKMVFSLDATSGYSRFRVQSCVFSNEADYRRIDAVRKPFITDSCPTAGQTIITIANTFRPVSDTVQETGYFMMNGIPPGQHVYIHCTIKACIFAAECPEPTCTGSGSARRRRRSAVNDTVVLKTDEPEAIKEVDISQSILLAEPKSSGLSFNQIIANKGTFITAICVILVVVIIVITVVMVCGIRYYRRRQADNSKLIVPECPGDPTPSPPYKQQAAKINPGFVHGQNSSYA